jgi:hypothetical protein
VLEHVREMVDPGCQGLALRLVPLELGEPPKHRESTAHVQRECTFVGLSSVCWPKLG